MKYLFPLFFFHSYIKVGTTKFVIRNLPYIYLNNTKSEIEKRPDSNISSHDINFYLQLYRSS